MPEQIEANEGRWCRFYRYVVVDGYIRPAKGANLEYFDLWRDHRGGRGAWKPPYGALLDLVQHLEFHPVPGPVTLMALSRVI